MRKLCLKKNSNFCIYKPILLAFLLVTSSYCSNDNTQIFITEIINNNNWSVENIKSFQFEVKDIQSPYNLNVVVKHTDEYPKSNLWLFITITNQNNFNQKDTVECKLARLDGKWLGQKKWRSWEISKPIMSGFIFPATGRYNIEIEHAMRFKEVKGIRSVGIMLQKHK